MGWQAWLTLAAVSAMFIAMVRGLVHPAMAILSAVIALLVASVIDAKQALSGFSNAAPITVAALYVLARAVEDTGILRPLVAATVVLTEFISNNAAAALMFPISVAISASNSFLTPIGYQTNTMVYGPGGYRFSDYLRLGAPLTIASVLTVVFTA